MKNDIEIAIRVFETPLGRMSVAANEKGLVRVTLPGADVADSGARECCGAAALGGEERRPSARTAEGGGATTGSKARKQDVPRAAGAAQKLAALAEREILDYLAGRRKEFTVAVDLASVPPFRQKVYRACAKVPFGTTATYRQLASRIGQPKAARAVGQAMAGNPVPLLVPCHRVIGSDGRLCGFMGGRGSGLALKKKLLELEQGK
jgi:methylated-DNA-[protein]-cysteine S-methyltransferase